MKLSGAERYLPEKVEQLEKYVDEQIASGDFNLDANLTLLRHYQFNPRLTKPVLVAKVLLKALMRLPHSDYKACRHLISERLQAEDTITKVLVLGAALETSRFTDFWIAAHSHRELIAQVPGFYEAARQFISQLLQMTFSKVTKKVLADSLKLEGTSLDQLIEQRCKTSGWSVVAGAQGDVIVFPKSEHNQISQRRTGELIKYEQVVPVLKALTVGL